MKMILAILSLLVSLYVNADILKVEYIDSGVKQGEPDLVYLSDGRIGILSDSKNSQAMIATEALRRDRPVNVKLSKKHIILDMKLANDQEFIFSESELSPKNDYTPTILPDLNTVDNIFSRMNRRWQKESQCYNRAHVWNYEEFKRTGLLSKKVFIFFTRRYIRNYNFYWWFHAIPTVLANNNGTVVERYLDPRYARTHLQQKAWTDIFIKSRKSCPVITKYSVYRDNQETEDCYLHFSSMYYWQPRDLEKFERTGFEKKDFVSSEVNSAYREAF